MKFAFVPLPKTRKSDLITKAASKIILCSENTNSIDTTAIHYDYQKKGKTGIPYHYVMKNDGSIYYTRPKLYQNEISPSSSSANDDIITNSIAVLLAGLDSTAVSTEIRDALPNFIAFLIEQEKLTLDSVTFLHSLTGTGSLSTNFMQIIKDISDALLVRNQYKTLIESQSNNGVKSIGMHDQIITDKKVDSYQVISKATGVPQPILAAYNPNITKTANMTPNTTVFIPRSKLIGNIIGSQQKAACAYNISRVDQLVTYKTIENKDYVEKKKKGVITDAYDIVALSTNYGGKSAPTFYTDGFDLPGYHNAQVHFIHNTNPSKTEVLNFAVSPSSFSDSRSITQQMSKTSAGWFIQRTGKAPSSVALTGYMLDIKKQLERHAFLEQYKRCVEDTKNERFESFYEYNTKIFIEGRAYYGYMQSISFSKSGTQPFLYQYNMNFVILGEQQVYNPAYAAKSMKELLGAQGNTLTSFDNLETKKDFLSDKVYEVLFNSENKNLASKVDAAKGVFLTQDDLKTLRKKTRMFQSPTNSSGGVLI
jgi:hypothetical protein